PVAFTKEYSEATAEKIDDEIRRILEESHKRVYDLIVRKKALLQHIASVLSEKEVIEGKDLEMMILEFEKPSPTKAPAGGNGHDLHPDAVPEGKSPPEAGTSPLLS